MLNASQARLAQREHFDVWWEGSRAARLRAPAKAAPEGTRERSTGSTEGTGRRLLATRGPVARLLRGDPPRQRLLAQAVYRTGMGPNDVFDYPRISDHDRPKPDGSPGGRLGVAIAALVLAAIAL